MTTSGEALLLVAVVEMAPGHAEAGRRYEDAVLALLDGRAEGATICPSEAARSVGGADWRALRPSVRTAAGRLVARGQVEITQGGEVVDGATATGPIRIRRVERG